MTPLSVSRLPRAAALLIGVIGTAVAATHDVRQFGARGDNSTLDTVAFQTAVDACQRDGGGTVWVPAGDYRIGMLRLRSHVTLHLESGATLWASRNPDDYAPSGHGESAAFGAGEVTIERNYRYLLVADQESHITLKGDGVIRGIGDTDLRRRRGSEDQPFPDFRVGMLLFRNCTDIAMRDLTIRDSDFWTLHFWRCDRLRLRGLTILNNFYHTNSDGIDPVSCRDVIISDCHIVAGDDCIALKADPDRACEKVVITNCTLESVATAVKLGTASASDFRDILVTNCTIRNSTEGIGVFIKDGGTAERVMFSNLSISTLDDPGKVVAKLENAVCPVFVDIEQRTDKSPLGGVREITFRDIIIRSPKGALLQGMPESPLRNVTLQNIVFSVEGEADFSTRHKPSGGQSNPHDGRITRYARQPTYFSLAHVDGLLVDNVQVIYNPPSAGKVARSAVSVFESADVRMRNVVRRPVQTGGAAVIALENCRNAVIAEPMPGVASEAYLRVGGPESRNVALVTAAGTERRP